MALGALQMLWLLDLSRLVTSVLCKDSKVGFTTFKMLSPYADDVTI